MKGYAFEVRDGQRVTRFLVVAETAEAAREIVTTNGIVGARLAGFGDRLFAEAKAINVSDRGMGKA